MPKRFHYPATLAGVVLESIGKAFAFNIDLSQSDATHTCSVPSPISTSLIDIVRLLARQAARVDFTTRCNASEQKEGVI